MDRQAKARTPGALGPASVSWGAQKIACCDNTEMRGSQRAVHVGDRALRCSHVQTTTEPPWGDLNRTQSVKVDNMHDKGTHEKLGTSD